MIVNKIIDFPIFTLVLMGHKHNFWGAKHLSFYITTCYVFTYLVASLPVSLLVIVLLFTRTPFFD